MLRWLALGIVLTLALGVATYSYQEAQAINPIKGYVSAGGTQVEVEIENGTTTTTSPETKPAPEPEECRDGDTDCEEHKEIEEKRRYEEGQETAGKVAETVKEKVTETVKGEIEEIEEPIERISNSTRQYVWQYADKTATEAINNANVTDSDLPPCRNTACLLEREHQARVDAYNQAKEALALGNVANEVNEELKDVVTEAVEGELLPCDSTACLMERKHQAELDEFYGVKKDSAKSLYALEQKIIVINLSTGCERALENNATRSICLTYEDLLQFDNTDQGISGEFYTDENGYFHRGESNFKKHCNFYLPEMFPVVIAVDGDTHCWVKERGAMLITINAITTENFQFKISDSYDVDRLRTIQKADTRILNDENEHQNNVDRLEKLLEQRDDGFEEMEERLEDFDEETRELFEDVGQNPDTVKIRENERKIIVDSYKNRSLDRQDTAWKKELAEAQRELDLVLAEKDELRQEQLSLKAKTSGVTTNSTIVFGIGRSMEQCMEAQIGSDLEMVSNTINYMLDNCSNPVFDNKMIIQIEQTPIDYLQHAHYQYKAWFDQVKKDCLGLCKEY